MIITFSPQRRDDTLVAIRNGDALTINGDVLDFSALADGDMLPNAEIDNEWVSGDVERIDGHLHICLLLPHGPNPSETVAFPEPIENPHDGVLAIPFDEPEPEAMIVENEDAGLTSEQITELEWSAFRNERDKRLSACDWTQLPDAPLTDEQREAWAEYRQLLRDLPDNTENPVLPVWPVAPA